MGAGRGTELGNCKILGSEINMKFCLGSARNLCLISTYECNECMKGQLSLLFVKKSF